MFSKACEYGLRATIYIAQKANEEKKIGIEEIAKAIDSPVHFTGKILQSLTRAQVVSSIKGPNGGFYITSTQRELPLISVLNAFEEDTVLRKCVLGLKECSEAKPCPMHGQYKSIKQRLISLFESKVINDLSADLDKGIVYINNKKAKSAK